MSLIGALAKATKAGETAKKSAPFYSAVDEALANLPRPKGTGAEFFTELSKQAGVKKAELADRKLEQAFKAKGKMTKEEAQQVLKDNPPPKLQEREFTEISDDERENLLRDRIEISGYDSWKEVPSRVIQKWNDEIDADMEKYGDYKTAGGKNYREIILKLPAFRPNPNNYRDPAKYDADLRLFNASGKSDYQSTHWKEDPNVLAHMRVQDRRGPNGEKILHVEEIQSDWHQEGRKKGYKSENDPLQKNENGEYVYRKADGTTVNLGKRINEEEVRQGFGLGTIPDAPFKKNWHELAMKRLLNYAADQGYDSIAITPGIEQAKRFNLRNQIDALEWDERTGRLYAKKKNDSDFNKMADGVTAENLSDYVGKEVADKLMSQPSTGTNRLLGGVDLEVGGEGMKGFYDQILPSYLNTFGKSYGAKVEPLSIDMGGFKVNRDSYPLPYRLELANSPDIISRFATAEEAWAEAQRMAQMPLHNFRITPEMRESIKQKGLPLYQQVGIPTVGTGAASQMVEPQKPEEPVEEAGMAGGGSIAKMAALAKLAKMREEMTPRAEAVKNLIARDEKSYLRDVVPNSLTNAEIEAEIARMKAKAEASQPEVKKAYGGAINFDTAPDMSDQGRMIQGAPFKRGGKVNMTANRDTMFLELSNKKLKRK